MARPKETVLEAYKGRGIDFMGCSRIDSSDDLLVPLGTEGPVIP